MWWHYEYFWFLSPLDKHWWMWWEKHRKKSHPIHVSVQTKLEFNTKWLQEKLQNMSGDILMTKNEEYDVYVMIIRRHRTIVLRTLFKKFTSKYCKMKYNVKYIAICWISCFVIFMFLLLVVICPSSSSTPEIRPPSLFRFCAHAEV